MQFIFFDVNMSTVDKNPIILHEASSTHISRIFSPQGLSLFTNTSFSHVIVFGQSFPFVLGKQIFWLNMVVIVQYYGQYAYLC